MLPPDWSNRKSSSTCFRSSFSNSMKRKMLACALFQHILPFVPAFQIFSCPNTINVIVLIPNFYWEAGSKVGHPSDCDVVLENFCLWIVYLFVTCIQISSTDPGGTNGDAEALHHSCTCLQDKRLSVSPQSLRKEEEVPTNCSIWQMSWIVLMTYDS